MTEPTILAVDDNHANLVALEASLAPLGHPVALAADADEALRKLLKQEFALLLLDVHLPGMSGFELAAMLKKHARFAQLPIIFITGVGKEAGQIFEGYSHGAVDYLLKPYDPELLRAKVRVFVELYRRQQKIREQAELLHMHELREIRRQTEEDLRDLVESMPAPVLRVLEDGRVAACNRAWKEYSGLSAHDTGALFASKVVHGDDVEPLYSAWKSASRERTPFELECRLRRQSDGEFRWHLLRGVPRTARAADPVYIVTATDIHVQKRAEEERARLLDLEHRAREHAEAASRLKDEFLATVSHELRTPLNAILGWCNMLRGGLLAGDRVGQALQTIARNAEAQAHLINDLLDVSRIVTGKMRVQAEPLKVRDVVCEAIETVRPTAEAKNVVLTLDDGCAGDDPVVNGDPSRLQQVVWNLLSNAVKFTPAGGTVSVRLGRDGEQVVVCVEDDGPGIAPDLLPHVFERFRQGDSSATRKHEGLGLGLAIVKHLVEAHGGTISAESDGPGRGARFTVVLPRARVDASPQRPTVLTSGPTSVRLDGTNVLFLDDHEDERLLVDSALSACGATVRTVCSVSEALRAIEEHRPDVIVSDIGLPDEDGYSFIRRLRALSAEEGGTIPAIALTAYGRPEDRRRARVEGFQVHLTKPTNLQELASLVASLSGRDASAVRAASPPLPPEAAATAAAAVAP